MRRSQILTILAIAWVASPLVVARPVQAAVDFNWFIGDNLYDPTSKTVTAQRR